MIGNSKHNKMYKGLWGYEVELNSGVTLDEFIFYGFCEARELQRKTTSYRN